MGKEINTAMPKGIQHGSSLDYDYAVSQFYGRIQERIVLFAAETGISAHWVAERLATLLSPPGERIFDHLPSLRPEAAGPRRELEPLALAEHAHSGQASDAHQARRAGGDDETPVKQSRVSPKGKKAIAKAQKARWAKQKKTKVEVAPSKIVAYWANMTPQERSKEMARRRRKWTPEALAKWKGVEYKAKVKAKVKAKATTKKPSGKTTPRRGNHKMLDAEAKKAKQQIYQMRHEARKNGAALPPLPPKLPSVAVQ
jgi:hypothetical protein